MLPTSWMVGRYVHTLYSSCRAHTICRTSRWQQNYFEVRRERCHVCVQAPTNHGGILTLSASEAYEPIHPLMPLPPTYQSKNSQFIFFNHFTQLIFPNLLQPGLHRRVHRRQGREGGYRRGEKPSTGSERPSTTRKHPQLARFRGISTR